MTQDLIPNAAETQAESQLTEQPRRFPQWRFWLPLLFQGFLILAVPARDAHTVITGTPVVLQTAPVDPYDILRGYYQTLSYDISQRHRLEELPGGQELFNSPLHGDRHFDFYVILEEPSETAAPGERPLPWVPIEVRAERPQDLPANQIALRGQYRNWQILYGLERYYMPENQRNDINDKIMQIQAEEPESFVVQIKVSESRSCGSH